MQSFPRLPFIYAAFCVFRYEAAPDPARLISGGTLNKRQWSAVSGLAVGALVAAALASPMQAQAAPRRPAPIGSDPAATQASRPDNLPNPKAEAAAALRADAVKKLVTGKASTTTIKGNRVIEVKSKSGKSKYVDFPVNREEDIFTVLVEFGDQIYPSTGGTAGSGPQQDPRAGPQLGRQLDRRQLDLLGVGLQPHPLQGPDVRRG